MKTARCMRRRTLNCALLLLAALLLALLVCTSYAQEGSGTESKPTRDVTSGNTGLYLGYIEILDHCVNWDELLDCAEFEHASKLNPRDCDLAAGAAHVMCIVIGAPVTESVIIP